MSSEEHDRGQQAAKRWLKAEGFSVKSPPETGGHQADAYGEKTEGETLYKTMVEVETGESLSDQHAKEQMRAFATWSKEYGSRKAVLFAPSASSEDAKRQLPAYDLYGTF